MSNGVCFLLVIMWKVKKSLFAIQIKCNLNIDLLSVGSYASGPQVSTYRPKVCGKFESELRLGFRFRNGKLKGSGVSGSEVDNSPFRGANHTCQRHSACIIVMHIASFREMISKWNMEVFWWYLSQKVISGSHSDAESRNHACELRKVMKEQCSAR